MSGKIPRSWEPMRFGEWAHSQGYYECPECFAIEQYDNAEWVTDYWCATCGDTGLVKRIGFSEVAVSQQEMMDLLEAFGAAAERGKQVFENLRKDGLIPSLKNQEEQS